MDTDQSDSDHQSDIEHQPDAASENENSDSDDENGIEEETPEDRETIRSELKTMSFAELLKLKDELGSKVYNEALFGEDTKPKRPKKERKPVFKRDNKNRPREVSARKQVPLLGKASTSKTDERPRDPRFDSKCGEFDRTKFKEDYSFVQEIREKEIIELKQKLREIGGNQTEEREKVKMVLQRMKNQNLEEKKLKERKEMRSSQLQKNKAAIKSEKKPFFVSKGEQKAQDLVKQYEELKKAGKLNKHLEKRRKKNVSRDRKKYDF